VDLETCGTDATDPSTFIAGIGFANSDHSFYVDVRTLPAGTEQYLKHCLIQSELIAFNVMFDGCFLARYTGQWNNWIGCSYGLFKQLSSEGYEGQSWSLDTAIDGVLGWEVNNKKIMEAALKERKLTKATMYQLPIDILGLYCAQDADAAWQLWNYLMDVAKPYSQLIKYHSEDFLNLVKLVAEQQFRGIYIDRDKLFAHHADLAQRIYTSMQSFLSHSSVSPHIEAFNTEVLAAWKAAEPSPKTALGKPSARHEAWFKRGETLLTKLGFNPNSKQQLGWLFFEKLGYKPLSKTPTGRPVIDKKTLPFLGEPGKILVAYNKSIKEQGYVSRLVEKSEASSQLHPQFNSVGTITGRLGGSGGFNLQQQPKSKGYLSCLVARPGHKLVQADLQAVEPVVLAEVSRDPILWSIYGPDAKPNDVYLFIAGKIPAIGANILKYYDPDNPTPEGISQAKKHCKRDRQIAKTLQLSCLAEGTLIRVQNRGYIPIESIADGDIVWDGEKWVATAGAVYMGTKKCITFEGVTATPDHKFLTKDGWIEIQEWTETSQLLRPQQPGATWRDVRCMAGQIIRCAASWAVSICSRWMSS